MTFESNINKPVFFSSILLIVAIMAVALIAPDFTQQFFDDVQHWLVAKASWLYILTVAIILVFAVTVMISRLGDIKLGPDHATPDYSNTSWFAMLFSAGWALA